MRKTHMRCRSYGSTCCQHGRSARLRRIDANPSEYTRRSPQSLPFTPVTAAAPKQALWRLARSGVAAADATVIAQLQCRGAALAVALTALLEDPNLGASAAGTNGLLAVVGLAAAVTHDTPTAALMGSAVASHGGVPKVGDCIWVMKTEMRNCFKP